MLCQFQLHPDPLPPPRATAGHLPTFSVPGCGHLLILRCPGAVHLPTPGLFSSFWHARGSYQNITTQRILLEKKQIGSSVKDRGLSKAMLSILCMHFFNVYQARITLRNSGAIDVNQRFVFSESNFCWYYLKNILSYGSWKEDVTWNKKIAH